ncbi:MAG: peptidyl-prolyl cis-trans isomerase [Sedimentisphaerales bacterium]|nr:peptidyl-prolyl cis-trans isomerase [Sedimentisphaerales bacterium]
MEEKLNFSLPNKKQKGSNVSKTAVILLLILVGLGLTNLLIALKPRESIQQAQTHGLSAEQTKQLAAKLSQRNLYDQAADTWQDYIANADLTNTERARAMFQAGLAFEKAGLYADAIEFYYRSETVEKLDDLAPQINSHIKDCFEKLGKFSALRYELMDRTSINKTQKAGGEVIAEIGAEKIMLADLDAQIENALDNQLSSVAAFMNTEQLNEQKKKMLEQYQNPQTKQQFLQSWLAQKILYREALEKQLAEKPEIKKLMNELAQGLLSQQLMNEQLASKINITQTDLETYYAANKDKFVEPAKAKISHILVNEEQQAQDIIKRIKNGEDFSKLAKELSQDEVTKDSGGKIDLDVTEGSDVPVVGNVNGLNEKIFAAEAPVLLDEAIKTEKGWEIVKVETKESERQKTFDEVRQQVMMMLSNEKRQDVQQDYIREMMDKYNVIIHTSVLAPSKGDEPESNSSGLQK